MKEIRKIWENVARNLPTAASLSVPSQFRTLNLNELREAGLLPELIKTYQQVFGDSDIWNEGAFCSVEGWINTISLEEYEKRKKEGKLRCDCGGIFQPCYPKEVLEARIVDELADSQKAVLVIMEGDNEFKIAGFLWGLVAEFDEIEQRILNARYTGRRKQGLVELSRLKSRLKERGLLNNKFLYGDEIGVLTKFRKGTAPYFYLIRLWMEKGISQHSKEILFWTARRSPLHRLALICGGEVIHSTRDGIEFFFHPDFRSVLKPLQHYPEEKLLVILRRAKKRLKPLKPG